MTTYELIKQLLKMDPDGNAKVFFSTLVAENSAPDTEKEVELTGPITDMWIENITIDQTSKDYVQKVRAIVLSGNPY